MEKKVSKLINDQINKEMYSAYLYLEFANHFTEKGLDGFANWYNIQAKEEMDHALKFIAYLHDNDEKVTYEAIAKPESKSKENLDVLRLLMLMRSPLHHLSMQSMLKQAR